MNQIVKRKILSILIASALITNCGVKQTDYDEIKAEKELVEEELKRIKSEQHETAMAGRGPKVEINNTEVKELLSQYNNQKYDVYIKFPTNYKKSGNNYPVLYVLDAEVNFGGISYIVQRLIKDGIIPEIFVVGIAYQGEQGDDDYYSLRCRDLTPTVDKAFMKGHQQMKDGAGGAENFAKFIELELFPFITEKYPVNNESRALYGHSFGGLFGFYVLLNRPLMFDKYLLLSPSLWWDTNAILKDAEKYIAGTKASKLYVGTGELENSKQHGTNQSMVDQHLEMVDLMKGKQPDNLIIKSEILKNETHRTIFGTGFTKGLRFIYSKEI